MLLEKGRRPRLQGYYVWSDAAFVCHAIRARGVVKLLLKKDVDLDSKDTKYGQSPLSYAAEDRHEAVVKLLLETDVDLNIGTMQY
jgi:ankyrin repeat protein